MPEIRLEKPENPIYKKLESIMNRDRYNTILGKDFQYRTYEGEPEYASYLFQQSNQQPVEEGITYLEFEDKHYATWPELLPYKGAYLAHREQGVFDLYREVILVERSSSA